jgi:ribonucleoside-diphosphate reductase alpha chain
MKFLSKRKKITEVNLGDLILSCDIKNQKDFYRKVMNVMRPVVEQEHQRRIVSASRATLITSDTHPTAINEQGIIRYVKGGEITVNDYVVSVENKADKVIAVDIPPVMSTQYADFSVDEFENYYAGMDPDKLLLAHNSCTVYFPIWHYQFDDLIVLKNNQGTEETRVRHLDYAVVLSAFFWRRFKNREDITFFDPNEVPEMYEAFYSDIDLFEKLYVDNEKRDDLRKKVISAEEVFKGGILKERTDTGRIYLMYTDNVQKQGPFDPKEHPIYQSNLCAEIVLPNKSFKRLDDDTGRISLCTLGSINWGAFRNPEDIRRACRILLRSLNNILDYQDFLSIQSKLSNDEIRPIGIGVTNLAYWHAKRGLKYGTHEALSEVRSFMEHQAFYLTEATVELAKERGACLHSDKTRYGQGVFPWELRAPGANELTDFTPELDWETLRAEMKTHGVRNATLMAIAPVESSSVVINSTNGIEMPMSLISTKESKAGSFTQVVPEYHKLKNKYQLMWDQIDCQNYLKTAAVLAAYVDQSISTNTFYSPKHFPDRKVPSTLIAKNLMQAHLWGLKSMYYSLIDKKGSKADAEEAPAMPLEQINWDDQEDDCPSCKL